MGRIYPSIYHDISRLHEHPYYKTLKYCLEQFQATQDEFAHVGSSDEENSCFFKRFLNDYLHRGVLIIEPYWKLDEETNLPIVLQAKQKLNAAFWNTIQMIDASPHYVVRYFIAMHFNDGR